MPIYEYRCTKCNHALEALQKMSDPPLRKCPKCGKQALEKLVSAASFRLKGGGWYETDFKTGDKRQLADSDSAPAPSARNESQDKPAASAASGKADTSSKASKENKAASSTSGSKTGKGKKAGISKTKGKK